jgi:1,4-alpha-glucan branching enzyme
VYRRKGRKDEDDLLVILNLTPVVRMDWVVEVPRIYHSEIFNSDAEKYGGSGNIYNPDIRIQTYDGEKEKYRLTINLPPLAGIILK